MNEVSDQILLLSALFSLAAYLPLLSGFPERLVHGGSRDKERVTVWALNSEFHSSLECLLQEGVNLSHFLSYVE